MKNKLQMINYKFLFLIVSFIMLIPSLIYLIKNKTILNFTEWFTFFLHNPTNSLESILGAIIFGILLIGLFYAYFKMIKHTKEEFKSLKSIIIYVIIILCIFGLMLPFTTSDIFYYIGTGWIDSHYGENPYYTTVKQVRMQNPNDEILQRTGVWEEQVVVYGPLWTLICKVLSWLSFGNVTLSLYIFKLLSIIIHILSTILVFKITKKKKFAVMYALNPFLLFEMITNVHNDLYLIFFILLSLYFLLKKKNIILTIIFMALATCIKYVSILLIPFLVLYYLRGKPIWKKIMYSFMYAILFILIVLACYLIYAKDLNLFFIMLMQQDKYRESILAICLEISKAFNIQLIGIVQPFFLVLFIVIYLDALTYVAFSKKNKFINSMRKFNNTLLGFIFLIITNLCPWYTSWLIPTMFWQKSKMIKNIIYIQFSYELVTLINFAIFSESYLIGLYYLPIMAIIIILFNIVDKIKISNTNNKKVINV